MMNNDIHPSNQAGSHESEQEVSNWIRDIAIANGASDTDMLEVAVRTAQAVLDESRCAALGGGPAAASLGDRLRAVKAADASAAAAAVAEESAEAERKRQREEATVRSFFDSAWAQFTTNIVAGSKPGEFILGHRGDLSAALVLRTFQWRLQTGESWQQGGHGVWCAAHVFHYLWLEFLATCEANGLRPSWSYDHDGVGIHSWWALTVDA